MSIFEFEDYKAFFNSWVKNQPNNGHGEYRRLANALSVSTTMISQVFQGGKHLSLELATDFADYLRLSPDEADYLLLLVNYQRAGSMKLRNMLSRQVHQAQEQARKVEKKMKKDMELDEATKGEFYSSWMYSGIRLLTDLESCGNVGAISERLSIPKNVVQKIVDFLVESKLCKITSGRLLPGPARTHVGKSSPFVNKHHQNWRLKSIESMEMKNEDDLFFTGPMALSKKAAEEIHHRLVKIASEMLEISGPTKSETVKCLNIDWFGY